MRWPAAPRDKYMPTTSPSRKAAPYGSRFASWIFSPPPLRYAYPCVSQPTGAFTSAREVALCAVAVSACLAGGLSSGGGAPAYTRMPRRSQVHNPHFAVPGAGGDAVRAAHCAVPLSPPQRCELPAVSVAPAAVTRLAGMRAQAVVCQLHVLRLVLVRQRDASGGGVHAAQQQRVVGCRLRREAPECHRSALEHAELQRRARRTCAAPAAAASPASMARTPVSRGAFEPVPTIKLQEPRRARMAGCTGRLALRARAELVSYRSDVRALLVTLFGATSLRSPVHRRARGPAPRVPLRGDVESRDGVS